MEKIKKFPSIRVFTFEVFLFSMTLGLGIVAAFKINQIAKIQELTIPKISFFQFILSFLFATAFILFVIKFLKFKKPRGIIFKLLFVSAVFLGGVLLLSLWIPDFFAILLILVLIYLWFKKPSILIQDILIILGIAGTGSFLGLSLDPLMIIVLLIIFSIYDFIAVYKTKHMIKMAKEMIESKAILALVVPPDIFSFREKLEKIKPGGKFLILGGGDIVFPLLFCSSLVKEGILVPLIVAIFSLLGLLAGFLFFISQKERKPIPALPPIALFSIIGYFLTRLI